MAKNYPRIRCPLCGALPYISSLRKFYPTELKIQIIKGGRAKKNWIKFYPVYDVDRLREVEEFLKQRISLLVKRFGINIVMKPQYLYPMATEMPLERQKIALEVEYA
jgi:hypothetical protein